jgi:hypothetical protein
LQASRSSATHSLHRRRRRKQAPEALIHGAEELLAQRRRRTAVSTSSTELDLRTKKNHRPGTCPKLQLLRIWGQRHTTSPEVARSSISTPHDHAAAALNLPSRPPEHTSAAPHRRWRRRRRVDSRPEDGDPTPHAQLRRHAGRAGELPQIRRHCTTATRGSRIWGDQNTESAAVAPTKKTAPATLTHTLSTRRTHRSGVPPPFRRRSGRRRGGEPAAAPGKRGGRRVRPLSRPSQL